MTIRRIVATALMIVLIPALALAQDTPAGAADAAPGASVLQVHDAPDQIIHVNTRIRHTTVIQLPQRENILDFIVGDSEYWHLSGAANLAFLKPIAEGVNTNVALVCESGRIYSFLVVERDAPPHLIVRVGADPTTTTPAGARLPAFVARSRVAEYQLMAEESRAAVYAAQIDAETQIAAMRQDANAQITEFRSSYPTRLEFPYRLDDKALALALSRTRHVARRPVYLHPIDGPGDTRALREPRRRSVPHCLRPPARRPVYRAAAYRVRLAANWPRPRRLED